MSFDVVCFQYSVYRSPYIILLTAAFVLLVFLFSCSAYKKLEDELEQERREKQRLEKEAKQREEELKQLEKVSSKESVLVELYLYPSPSVAHFCNVSLL